MPVLIFARLAPPKNFFPFMGWATVIQFVGSPLIFATGIVAWLANGIRKIKVSPEDKQKVADVYSTLAPDKAPEVVTKDMLSHEVVNKLLWVFATHQGVFSKSGTSLDAVQAHIDKHNPVPRTATASTGVSMPTVQWETYVSSTGSPYYYNRQTEETQTRHPNDLNAIATFFVDTLRRFTSADTVNFETFFESDVVCGTAFAHLNRDKQPASKSARESLGEPAMWLGTKFANSVPETLFRLADEENKGYLTIADLQGLVSHLNRAADLATRGTEKTKDFERLGSIMRSFLKREYKATLSDSTPEEWLASYSSTGGALSRSDFEKLVAENDLSNHLNDSLTLVFTGFLICLAAGGAQGPWGKMSLR